MNYADRLKSEGVLPASTIGHPAEDEASSTRDYLRIESCPCCGSPAAKAKRHIASSPPAETLSPERHGKFLSGYTSARVFFTYFKCLDCSALFCPTYYRQSQLEGLYGRQAENMVAVPLPARQRTQDDYVSLLRRHCRMAGNFLEIGPDIGLFTSSLAKTGSFNHLWLYEPNRNVHQSLSDGLRGLSHTINENFFRASDVPAESVSTTVMIHVLDHVLQPMDLLRQIRTSLEPGGIIFIVTHDCDSLLALLMGRRWPPYTLQHPQLFSRRSIATLLQLSGFEMIETVKTTNYFPASFLMQAALAVCGLSRAGVSGGAAPLVPVKLGNIAAIARKPA